ncbi:hypothetical protein [Persicobacter sp. CCB-QB2]|uniref:hypothetical protein n=1 Tax=Persicobacter sp. CCB-QB2 TaxID=1561025 RepID=UPI0006A9479D|nr:hypothetical protein [Persicobacter sp. CCB-QB2]
MKNFFYLPLLAMMTLVFTSCSETEDILPDSTTVEITATGTPTGVVTPGTQISVALKLRSSDNSLKGLVMSGPGVEHTYEDIANTDKDEMPKEGLRSGDEYVYTNSKQIDYVMNHTVSQDEFEAAQETGKMVYEFILSDKNGQKTTSVEFEVEQDNYTFVDEEDITLVYVNINQSDGRNESEAAGIRYTGNDVDANTGNMMVFSASDMIETDVDTYQSVVAADESSYMAAMDAYENGSKISEISIKADSHFETKYVIVKKEDGDFSVIHFTGLRFAAGDNQADLTFKLIGIE